MCVCVCVCSHHRTDDKIWSFSRHRNGRNGRLPLPAEVRGTAVQAGLRLVAEVRCTADTGLLLAGLRLAGMRLAGLLLGLDAHGVEVRGTPVLRHGVEVRGTPVPGMLLALEVRDSNHGVELRGTPVPGLLLALEVRDSKEPPLWAAAEVRGTADTGAAPVA